jgi:hypothetical protein
MSMSHQSPSANCGARAIVAVVTTTNEWPSNQLILAADEGAEGDRGEAVAGALGDHLLALAALPA